MNELVRARAAVDRGAFDEAQRHAERACQDQPGNAECWFLLGAIQGALGDFSGAKLSCSRSADLRPDVPVTHYNLGVAQLRTGDYDGAIVSLRRATVLAPDMADAYGELGNALQAAGQLREAVVGYRQALLLRPASGALRFNLAKALAALNETDAALVECNEAIARDPRLTETHALAGALCIIRGRHREAAKHFMAILAHEPDHFDALLGCASALRDLGAHDEAERYAHCSASLRPESAEALNVLGTIQRAAGKLSEAESSLRAALRHSPEMAVAWNNLGIVHEEAGRLSDAETAYRTCLSLNPDQFQAYNNLSLVLREQNRWPEALDALDAWVAREPNPAEARGERALVLLQMEDYVRGWPEYEWRWRREGMNHRSFGHRLWDGAHLDGKTLLVFAEQGIGDEIMFASCYNELIAQAGRVVIDCAPRLAPLFRRSFPLAKVFGAEQVSKPGWLGNASRIDVEITAGDVARFLRNRPEDFPGTAYLVADPQRVTRWRERYAAIGSGLKIGISWRGGYGARAARCSTQLTQWREVLDIDGAIFVNLQYAVRAEELEEVSLMGGRLHHWSDSDPLSDLDDFAAQVSALDLVITIDNATAHLAGALGVPLWVLQPRCPDWRWGISGKGYWYRGTRAFRQENTQEWSGVFSDVREHLSRTVENRST